MSQQHQPPQELETRPAFESRADLADDGYAPAPTSPFKPIAVILVVIVGLVAFTYVRKAVSAKERVPWRTDLSASLDEAEKGNKRLFVYFTATWCPPCQQMKSTTFADASVAEALQGYVPVKVDVDQQPTLARDFKVKSIPQMVLLSPAGDQIDRSGGYMPSAQLISWIRSK